MLFRSGCRVWSLRLCWARCHRGWLRMARFAGYEPLKFPEAKFLLHPRFVNYRQLGPEIWNNTCPFYSWSPSSMVVMWYGRACFIPSSVKVLVVKFTLRWRLARISRPKRIVLIGEWRMMCRCTMISLSANFRLALTIPKVGMRVLWGLIIGGELFCVTGRPWTSAQSSLTMLCEYELSSITSSTCPLTFTLTVTLSVSFSTGILSLSQEFILVVLGEIKRNRSWPREFQCVPTKIKHDMVGRDDVHSERTRVFSNRFQNTEFTR